MGSLRTLIPDPLASDRQYNRFSHSDIVDMSIEDLLYELYALRSHLWLLKSNWYGSVVGFLEQAKQVQWAEHRLSRIRVETGKRRYSTQELKSQPKPRPVLSEGVRL
ncbi:MAG: hypothetical protein A2Y60_01865 [Chloroflexi bacterium RBG_13_54_9]|nr:MAG: hypothetical protein A2Y60_01865 [Chloroflexi bacterium RBG_13_54_9]